MNEKDKMLANEWYDANYDENLLKERMKAQDLCHDFNQTRPSDEKRRQEILVELFGYIPKNAKVASPFMTDYGYNVKLGENVFININNYFMDGAEITLGNNVFVDHHAASIRQGTLWMRKTGTKGWKKHPPYLLEVMSGWRNVSNAGVGTGEGSVVGAGSVVTKDIPPNVLAAGVPCKVIREID